jgi:hypothetical protein
LLGAGRTMSSEAFTSSHFSTNGDGFMKTACLIAGECAPRWLAKHLQRWSSSVMIDGNVHAKQFGKAEARARLQKLSDAAESVGRELQDPVIAVPLLVEEFGPLPNNAGPDAVLGEIRRRADIASSRLDLLGTGLDVRLENVSDGAKLICRELQDSELSEFLRAEQIIGPPARTIQLGGFLMELRRQADAALLSPYLADEAGKTQSGRGRALLPNVSRPRAFCAAVILEAWAHFHDGDYPRGSNHTPLWKAAEEYWAACGGVTKGGWDYGKLTTWRPYFREASEDSLSEIRTELRRQMKLSMAYND